MSQLLFSVIIPTHNSGERLQHHLERFLENAGLPAEEFEIIVVDSGSQPALVLDGFPPNVKLLRSEDNIGRSGARNLGISQAKGERLLLLDDDIRVVPGFLSHHKAATVLHPKSAILGRVMFDEGELRPIDLAFDTASYFTDLVNDSRLSFIQFITANLSIPLAPVREAGGFDEEFHGWGYEDLELGYRLEKRHGVSLYYCADAAGTHVHCRSADEFLDRCREKGKNAFRLFCLHPGIGSELKLEVDTVINRFHDPEFFIDDNGLEEMRVSCHELEETEAWRENDTFLEMVVTFWRNLGQKLERVSIRQELTGVLQTATVVIAARHGLNRVLETLGSIISCHYPLELVKVIVFDPQLKPELKEFFRSYEPPVPITLLQGPEAELRRLFRQKNVAGDMVLFIDDTLRASRTWLLDATLAHARGVEKLMGRVLPDTPLGRYLATTRIFLDDAALETRQLLASFTNDGLLNKQEEHLRTEKTTGFVALRTIPSSMTRGISDMHRFWKLCRGLRPDGPRRGGWRFMLSLLKYTIHVGRFRKEGHSFEDAVFFPLFEKIRHYHG